MKGMLLLMLAQGLAAPAPAVPQVPLYDNLGSHHYPVTVAVPLAQQYFDQGLRLSWAFNHEEAIRAFAAGEAADSSCAMCAWGIAYALGPNINAPMDSVAESRALAAIGRARMRAADVTAVERDLIEALTTRYGASPAGRATRDSAWARAMDAVARRYPDVQEARALAADALMNLSPWYYWERDGTPRPATPAILLHLETVLAVNPDHPGACHLYIHAVEAAEPAKALPCAENLAALMPGAGHIVHMPGHIYIRVGRYADAVEANSHAVHADESYLEGPAATRQGVYPQGYYPHNYHFMAFAATMAGQSRTALMAARRVARELNHEVARQHPWLENVTPIVWWTMVNFGRWDDILAAPLPPSDLRYLTGMAFYSRGVAFAAKERWAEARAALDTVEAVAAAYPENQNRVALQIAALALRGEIAQRRGELEQALVHVREATRLEDGLGYMEPPTWYFPMRHSLGKLLLALGRPQEAEEAYREDLERFPENGWALRGLALALEAQGRSGEARTVMQRFETAWSTADVRIDSSRF